MSPLSLIVSLLALSVFGYYFGRRRAFAMAGGRSRSLHSRPGYYGAYVALWCAIPALAIFAVWLIVQPSITESVVIAALPDVLRNLGPDRMSLLLNDIRNVAGGVIPAERAAPEVAAAAAHLNRLNATGNGALAVVALALAVAGLAFARTRLAPTLRARNGVEKTVDILLIACSSIAILTTVGIVLSLVFESIRFFGKVPFFDFVFGIEWSPQTALRDDQVGATGVFGAIPALRGDDADHRDRDAYRGSGGPAVGDLSLGLRGSARSRGGQAGSGDPRGHPDRGLRLLRRADGRSAVPRAGRGGRARRRLGKRARGGRGDGDHDHPLHLVPVGRRDERRPPGASQRIARDGRHQVGDDQAGDPSRPPFPAYSPPACSR